MRDLPEPMTNRGQRVFVILKAARDRIDLATFRRDHDDLWPAGHAGDRKWVRDCRDALDGRVYGPGDEVMARRIRLLDWLEEHGPATTAQIVEALGYASTCHAWVDLKRVKARFRTVPRPGGAGGRASLWRIANLAPARARRAA